MDSFDEPPRIRIRVDTDRRSLERLSLVLTATGIDNGIETDEASWCLWVPRELAARAERELEKYAQENRVRIAPAPRPVTIDSGWVGVICFLLIIWLLPSLEAAATFGWDWRSIGAMDAAQVAHGERWRTLTALTLHADLGHLLGNSLFGAVFGVLVGRHLGSGLGWLLIVCGGVLGNAIDASLRPDEFLSIGASTATFAAVGLLGAFVWRRGYYRALDWRRSAAPIFAAIALLAFTGIEGERIDVVAHAAGFASGACLGGIAARYDVARIGTTGQLLCGTCAVALVTGAWALAGLHG